LVILLSHNCFAGWHCVSRFVLEVDALALHHQRPLLHVRVDGTEILSQNDSLGQKFPLERPNLFSVKSAAYPVSFCDSNCIETSGDALSVEALPG